MVRLGLEYEDENEFLSDLLGEISMVKNSGISLEHYYSANCSEKTFRDVYKLYDEIQLFNYSESTNFFANVLKWNAKTEQLTSGRGDMVRIEKDDAVIRGTGFSASGIGKTFSFKGTVTGEIETESSSESEK